MPTNASAGGESRPETKSPRDWADFFNKELEASHKTLKKWQKQARKTVEEYIDERGEGNDHWFKLNLFHANITTLKSMMYGNLPQASVSRKFLDQNDDVARVAGLILERMLNNDLQENGEEYDVVLRNVLEDRLVPGMGCAYLKYEMDTKTLDSTVWDEEQQKYVTEEQEVLDWEDAQVHYQYWGDVLWSWARNWSEVRWVAFRHALTREQVKARFGTAKKVQSLRYTREAPTPNKETEGFDRDSTDSIDRAEIWEIWDKESGKVFWHQKNQSSILDSEDDPLELEGFFPCPPFFIANTTTSLYRPTPDFYMAKDLYMEVNRLETRIAMITEAVKVVGVYDKQQEGVQRMLKEGIENDLVPVDNWAMMAEKGGLKGVIDWFPVLEVANTLDKLVAQRNDVINLLYQVTGMSDILRGAASQSRVSATEQELKAKFASVRVQALQDAFARFCSDLLQIRAEIICKHYDPQTIAQQANVAHMNPADQQLVGPAIQLLKTPGEMYFRVNVTAESVAMVDMAKKQQERTEYIQSLGFYLQSMTPFIQAAGPSTQPMLYELLKWGLAGFKGSDEIEGVIDQAIEQSQQAAQQAQQNPQPDPEQIKAQVEMQKAQAKMKELEMKMQHDQQKHQFEMREVSTKHELEMQKLVSQFQADMAKLQAQVEGKVVEQSAQTEGKVTEIAAATESKLIAEAARAQAVQTDQD